MNNADRMLTFVCALLLTFSAAMLFRMIESL